jgi:hypothetical protein
MKKYKYITLGTLFMLSVLSSCNKAELNGILENSKVPPGKVSNVTVVNENGQAKISYNLPNNNDLLYVKAVYSIATGEQREILASGYTNTLTVDGFSDTNPHEVKLFAVNKSEVASEPVSVTVKPLIAPFRLIFNELKASATFGGIRINAVNKFKASVAIVPLLDSLGNGDWANLDNVYTKDSVISTSIRGLKPKPGKYAFYVRDRWLNRSDTLYVNLTPLEENLLNKDLFQELRLPGDADFQYNTTLNMIWDKRTDLNQWPCMYTNESAGSPQTVSFSIGREAKLSRIVIYPRREAGYYDKGNLRDFEMWGSNSPNLDGTFASWTKLMTSTVVKPSGSPLGTDTGADDAYGRAGWSFDFPEDAIKYKYLRIRCLKNWRSSYFMEISQVSIWGVY